MKTFRTLLRLLSLCLVVLNLNLPLAASSDPFTICPTQILIKQGEGSGSGCPEQAVVIIHPQDLNNTFGRDLLLSVQPGNRRIMLAAHESRYIFPIHPGIYTFTTTVIGTASCQAHAQDFEFFPVNTKYDIQFEQYHFACAPQPDYKVGIIPAGGEDTFGIPMKIRILPLGRIFDVEANSGAFLLTLPAGQYQLISESTTDPNCRKIQQIEVQGANSEDTQPPIFISPVCGTTTSRTIPNCLDEIHYLIEAQDDCGTATITNNYNDELGGNFGDIFPPGTHELVFTARDEAGNQSDCKINFSLTYNGPVNALCVANASVIVNEGLQPIPLHEVAIINPSGEYCDEIFEITPPYVTCEDIGIKEIKVYQKGNSTPLCETSITVEPGFDFSVSCQEKTASANENQNGECGAEVIVELELETIGCWPSVRIRNDHNDLEGLSFTDFFPIGRHEVTFFLEQNGSLLATCTNTITVTEDPTGLSCFDLCVPSVITEGTTYTFNTQSESWKLGTKENAYLVQEDDFTIISTPMVGDGIIVAKVSQMSPKARAGVMMRESCDPGSKFIATFIKPYSRNAYQRHRTNENASSQQIHKRMIGGYPKWVKLKREGDTFYSYASKNGYSWKLLFKTTLRMDQHLQWGLMIESSTRNIYADATFNNIQLIRATPNALENQRGFHPNTAVENHIIDSHEKQDAEDLQLSIYPNPSTGQVNIRLPLSANKAGTLEIIDMMGKLLVRKSIKELNGQSNTYNWQTLNPGVYLISLKLNGQTTITKHLVIHP